MSQVIDYQIAEGKTAQLAPFEIWEVPFGNATIKFFEPLVLMPTLVPDDPDEPDDNEYLQVVCPELNIDVFAENHDDLLGCVLSDLRFIWKHIVSQSDDRLDTKSLAIKRNHLAIAEVIDG